ncbi:hypothetical protein, partial [Mesorhizobium japonicum]|uniref:hypothetical protein n=1 Tax=Mesorhizobium japonicum TaxID=2066070 RepID=UPI003B5C3CE5
MSESAVLRWDDGALRELDETAALGADTGGMLAADSWLLRDGTALALDAHRGRFLRSLPPA